MVFLAIPTPSFVRFATLVNNTNATIAVRISSIDGVRHKERKIMAGQKWKFLYFSGDNDGRAAIASIFEGKNLSSGASFSRQIELPISKEGPTIVFTEDWFH